VALYRKKPVVVEAMQFTGDNYDEIWDTFGADGIYGHPGSTPRRFGACRVCGPTEKNSGYLILTTVHGDEAPARAGDWVIRDGKPGTFYPCKPDIFEATYEPAGGEASAP
jgi:hypothetical protein